MQIETIRFGSVEVDESKFITFAEGIPGLEDSRTYALLQFEESYPIIWLQSIDEGGICLPVLDTFAVLTDYVFEISDEDVNELELQGPEQLHVVSVVVIPNDVKGMTANLAAPIIINTETGKAKQIMLTGIEYNVRAPVFAQICEMVNREEGDGDAGTVTEAE
ncbi:MAG: flagellar assembly protein FliW [Oscillospiraceae bacterium]|nr:flagellar assembly protein FliW [Oscillospiraceae bacterium]